MGSVKVCPVCHREYASAATNCSDDGVPLVALDTNVALRAEDLVGRIVEGRYKIERIIGKGGMGTVYACRHVVVGKVAAMKVLRVGVERGDGVLQRFVREAQTANLLRSRHIVEVSDFGQLPNGSFFVVMELLEGHDLSHAMRHGLSRAELVHIFTQVADTLQLAHDKGIVHRDLKPDNVFLVNDGGDPRFVKLLDFGIAKIVHGESNGGLTETGVILGTPYYMSPEQARADLVDHRSDIYSLGVMMYRAFTGKLPFIADSTMGVLTRHITEDPEPPSRLAAMDQATERLILRCLAKRKEDRFQSMREVVEALRLVPTGPVNAVQEHTTVFEGPMAQSGASAAYPAQASGAYQQAASSAYQRAQSGAYQQQAQSGAYQQQGQSGAYQQAQSGAYQQQAQSGAYQQAQSGAYQQAQSGAYQQAQSGAHGAPAVASGVSGAYGHAVPVPDPAASGAFAASARTTGPSGAYPAATSGAYAAPGFDPRASGAIPAPPAVEPPQPTGSGETTRGLAATGAMPAARAGTSSATIVMGAIAMASLGALGALLLYRARPAGPAPATTVVVVAAPPPLPAATASAAAAPSTTASAAPSAEPSAAPRPRTGAPLPKSAPTASAAPPPKNLPRDIRSPFD